jgi:hypothetical protein
MPQGQLIIPFSSNYGIILWDPWMSETTAFTARAGVEGARVQGDRTKNSTRQLHESIVIEWMCKCECRTHRESALLKINFKMPKLKIP